MPPAEAELPWCSVRGGETSKGHFQRRLMSFVGSVSNTYQVKHLGSIKGLQHLPLEIKYW